MVVWLLSGDMLTQQADADDMAVDFAPELQLDVTVAVRGERSEALAKPVICLLYTSPSPRDKRQSRMPSSA